MQEQEVTRLSYTRAATVEMLLIFLYLGPKERKLRCKGELWNAVNSIPVHTTASSNHMLKRSALV